MKKAWKITLGVIFIFSLIFVSFRIGYETGINEKSFFINVSSTSNNTSKEIANVSKSPNPTRWDMLNLPSVLGENTGALENYETGILCTDDLIIVDANLNYQFPHSCGEKAYINLPGGYLAQLDKEGLIPLKLVAAYNFNEYGSKYDWEEFEI